MNQVVTIAFVALLCLTPPGHCQQPFRKKVVWSDEFAGKEIDRSVWTHDVGGHGFGNGQLEYNTARPDNSYIKDGNLVLEARRESYRGMSFTSARMHTLGSFAFRYGTLEARIKVPDTSDGIWPAFWMLGNNFPAVQWPKCGEADILEIGSKEGIARGLQHKRINCAIHFAGADQKKTSRVSWFDARVDLHRAYHLYRVSWTPSHMRFFLDDTEIGSWDISAAEFREFHQPFFPVLNVAVGSWKKSYTGIDTADKVTATFPARMYVDWIRLYPNAHTKVYLGNSAKESGPFGIFADGKSTKQSLKYADATSATFPYGNDAALFIWNNMTKSAKPAEAAEGKQCWSYDVAPGAWFGMGVFLPNYRNMSRYSDGFLHFNIKSKSTTGMKVGIKSSITGEAWIPLGDEKSEFGFARDGRWHSVRIPLKRFAGMDFPTIHQMFMIAGDASASPFTLSIDRVWWQPTK